MKKLLIGILFLSNFLSYAPAQASALITIGLGDEDRQAIAKASKSIAHLAQQIESNKISKALTQGGVVLISTATAILSAYSVFLVIRYQFSKSNDLHQSDEIIDWKSHLAGSLGSATFLASLAALIKSNAIADYAISN